jgi:hypothetical protein
MPVHTIVVTPLCHIVLAFSHVLYTALVSHVTLT